MVLVDEDGFESEKENKSPSSEDIGGRGDFEVEGLGDSANKSSEVSKGEGTGGLGDDTVG